MATKKTPSESAAPAVGAEQASLVYYEHDIPLTIGEFVVYSAPAEVTQLHIVNAGGGDVEIRYPLDANGVATKDTIKLAVSEECTVVNTTLFLFSYSCPVVHVQQLT